MIKHGLGSVSIAIIIISVNTFNDKVTAQSTQQPITESVNKPILPDAQGNYLSNLTNSWGNVLPDRQKDSPGSLWRVVAPSLQCRNMPNLKARSVRTFPKGTVLQADVGRAGSDEVYLNALDQQRKPWMLVRSREGLPYQCYVRANRKFIAPFP